MEVDWAEVANAAWPGYALGTCIYSGECGVWSWSAAIIGAVPIPGASEAGPAVSVTAKGIARIERHPGSLGALDDAANQAMLQRLRDGLTTQHDINFYLHELKESALMRRGAGYDAAHEGALRWQGIPYNAATPASLYHPDVIRQLQEWFNSAAWLK